MLLDAASRVPSGAHIHEAMVAWPTAMPITAAPGVDPRQGR
jgi:hypothetical protein